MSEVLPKPANFLHFPRSNQCFRTTLAFSLKNPDFPSFLKKKMMFSEYSARPLQTFHFSAFYNEKTAIWEDFVEFPVFPKSHSMACKDSAVSPENAHFSLIFQEKIVVLGGLWSFSSKPSICPPKIDVLREFYQTSPNLSFSTAQTFHFPPF